MNDDLYIERHQSTWYADFIHAILEKIEDSPEHQYSEARLNELKEQILSNGYFGFVYDW